MLNEEQISGLVTSTRHSLSDIQRVTELFPSITIVGMRMLMDFVEQRGLNLAYFADLIKNESPGHDAPEVTLLGQWREAEHLASVWNGEKI
jgi:hypothetical protein